MGGITASRYRVPLSHTNVYFCLADIGDLRSTIAAIKTNSGYTDAIGTDLGIVGSGRFVRSEQL
jgi:hypothetical protein